jgi:hypothetical protein
MVVADAPGAARATIIAATTTRARTYESASAGSSSSRMRRITVALETIFR